MLWTHVHSNCALQLILHGQVEPQTELSSFPGPDRKGFCHLLEIIPQGDRDYNDQTMMTRTRKI